MTVEQVREIFGAALWDQNEARRVMSHQDLPKFGQSEMVRFLRRVVNPRHDVRQGSVPVIDKDHVVIKDHMSVLPKDKKSLRITQVYFGTHFDDEYDGRAYYSVGPLSKINVIRYQSNSGESKIEFRWDRYGRTWTMHGYISPATALNLWADDPVETATQTP